MKECKSCGKEIDDKYEYCIQCIQKVKETNTSQDMIKVLEHLNWNAGATQKWIKLMLLNNLENLKNGQGMTPTQQKIHKLLLKDVEKDFKNIEDISKELNE